MGRIRTFAAFLSFACGVAAGARVNAPPPIREAQWIVAERRADFLTSRPPACIRPGSALDGEAAYGAVAFRDPLLLGGQAARAGLNCASCHRNGQGNPGFRFPGLSGAAGTADVTSSILSSHRGDGVFNPRPIPDLVRDPPQISRTKAGVLEQFITSLIVEEFDGAPPPPPVLRGLADYVRALDPAGCKNASAQPFRLADALTDYAAGLKAAEQALLGKDRDTALAMLRAARSALGAIDERYRTIRPSRRALNTADAALQGSQSAIRAGADLAPITASLAKRRAAIPAWAKPLFKAEPLSLFAPAQLTRAGYGS